MQPSFKCINLGLEDVVVSSGISLALNTEPKLLYLFQHNADRISRYYQKKWGTAGCPGVYSFPFNDITKGINEWELWEPFNNILLGPKLYDYYEWRVPDLYPYNNRRIY